MSSRPYKEIGAALVNYFGSPAEVLAHKKHLGHYLEDSDERDLACDRCEHMPYISFEYTDEWGTGKSSSMSDVFWDAPIWFLENLMEEEANVKRMTFEEFEELYGETPIEPCEHTCGDDTTGCPSCEATQEMLDTQFFCEFCEECKRDCKCIERRDDGSIHYFPRGE